MGSRIRENPTHVFECFFEVVIPSENEKNAWILQKYPEDFDDKEVLKSVPEFSCPCEFNNTAIQHFSFVLTNLDSKWSFGYCRHAPNTPTLIVLLSHLPWHETFYKILNQIADLTNAKETSVLTMFLESFYNSSVPDPGLNLHVQYNEKEFIVYCPNHLKLPSIPENRNLTEYFNAIDAQNMMIIFSSMLHERRILVTSKKLSRLSACVQAANSLIYPMHWQHIFIPVLPKHLIDYLR
ncbi:UNVERIFIED_CONTAM: DENN domain-containing protein 1A [Trichonephila clavipes]